MAYYMTVEKKKGEFVPLNVTKATCFARMSKLKNGGATLAELDNFTMSFYDEEELRNHLLREGILAYEDGNKGLSIRNYVNKKYHKVMYDFLYQKDIDYICFPKKLIERIHDKLLTSDFRFVEGFANHFLEYHECRSTAPEVRAYAKDSITLGVKSKYFDWLDEHYDNPLVRMTKLLIYNYEQGYDGRIRYSDTVKYRNLHAILAYVNYYDKKHNEEIIKKEKEVKTKKKSKEIPGQISIDDILK